MQDAPDAATGFRLAINLSDRSGLTEEAAANRELVMKTYLALEAGQEDALTRILDPQITFHEPASLPYGGTRHGIDGALQGVTAMLAAWHDISA